MMLSKTVLNLLNEPQHLTKLKNSETSLNSKQSSDKFTQTEAKQQLKLHENKLKIHEKCQG